MKTLKEIKQSKVPFVIIDNSLKELNKQNLFPQKVKRAEETIAKIGLPKREKEEY